MESPEHFDQETETMPNNGLAVLQEIPVDKSAIVENAAFMYDEVVHVGQKRKRLPSVGRRVRIREEPWEEDRGAEEGKPEWELMMEPEEASDVHDPNYYHEYQDDCEYEAIAPELTVENWEKPVDLAIHEYFDPSDAQEIIGWSDLVALVETVDPVIHEYFQHGNTQEIILYLAELNLGKLRPYLVALAVFLAIEPKPSHREMICVLISDMFEFGTLTQLDIQVGFDVLLEKLPDLVLGTPDAPTVLGKFIARAVADDCLPPNYVQTSIGNVECVHVRDALEHADALLSMKHNLVRLDNVWGVGVSMRPVKYVINQIYVLLGWYLNSGDSAEACRCIQELGVPHFHYAVVFEAIVWVIEDMRESSMDLMFKLLQVLASSATVTMDQMSKGFFLVSENFLDTYIDARQARTDFKKFVAMCHEAGFLSDEVICAFSSFSASDLPCASSIPTSPVIPLLIEQNRNGPKTLRVPPGEPNITTEMDNIINSALQRIKGCADEEMCEMNSVTVLRRHLATLNSNRWLVDAVLNFYLNLIVERSKSDELPSAYAHNTFFYTSLLLTGINRVLRWTKASEVDIFSFNIVFIPVHICSHWVLCVIDNRSKIISYYDSMEMFITDQIIKRVRTYLIAEMKDKKGIIMDPNEYQLKVVKDCPMQTNDSDCGMFVLKYAEFISRNVPLTFEQDDIPYYRRRMIYEILTKQLL